MENWRDLVTVVTANGPNCKVKHFQSRYKPDSNDTELEFIVTDIPVVCNLTEDQLINQLDTILTSFTTTCKNDHMSIAQAKNNVAAKTRQGPANMTYKNAMYYKGSTSGDSPILVGEYNGMYGIFKHPNFDTYGFTIEASVKGLT